MLTNNRKNFIKWLNWMRNGCGWQMRPMDMLEISWKCSRSDGNTQLLSSQDNVQVLWIQVWDLYQIWNSRMLVAYMPTSFSSRNRFKNKYLLCILHTIGSTAPDNRHALNILSVLSHDYGKYYIAWLKIKVDRLSHIHQRFEAIVCNWNQMNCQTLSSSWCNNALCNNAMA